MSRFGQAAGILFSAILVSSPAQAQSTFTALPRVLTFRAAAGQFSPMTLNVVLYNPGSTDATWQSTITGDNWLTLPATGNAPPGNTSVPVRVNPAGLRAGSYTNSVWFALAGSAQPQVRVAVNLVLDALAPVSGPVTVNLSSTAVGFLAQARAEAQATALDDGRVLISGGWNFADTTAADLFTPGSPVEPAALAPAASMNYHRRRHSATLLATGEVLVAGGSLGADTERGDTELYRRADDTWEIAGRLREGRYYHAALLLPDGRVLVAGGAGANSEPLASTEIYNPATKSWDAGAALNVPRSRAAMTLLADGRVLITGGVTTGNIPVATVELLDPAAAAAAWRMARPLAARRQQHTATRLPRGQVLVAGGWDGGALGSTEIYDPATDQWTAGPPLAVARYDHRAFLLPAGVVFFLGGWADTGAATGETEVYNPAGGGAAGTLTSSGAVTARAYHAAALLSSGQVLAAGGLATPTGARLASVDLISVEAVQSGTGRLAVNPASVELVTQSAPVSQTVALTNAGTGTLTWTAAADRPWVTLDASLGTAPAALAIGANPAGLAPGAYQANVTLTSPEASNSPLVIPVRLQVGGRTSIALSAPSISVDAVFGVNPSPQVVLLTNGGVGSLNWTADSNAAWLAPDPSSGGAPSTVILNLNTLRLSLGTHRGEITFTSREAANSPLVMPVTVRVSPAPQLGLARSSLDFHGLPGRDPDAQVLVINNPTGVPVTWTAASSQPWISVNPTVGSAPGQATIQVASAQMAPGRYDGEVVFTAPGASNSPRTLYVYLEVRTGFEPRTSISLEPGFYIVEATLDRGESPGWWGMEVIASRGAAGGFNLGGALWENANAPAFCAFNVPARLRVTARVETQVLPGGNAAGFRYQLRFRNSAGRIVAGPVSGAAAAELAVDLTPGFYIAEVQSNPGAPRAAYQMALDAASLTGGLATGGLIASNVVGFGAFYLSEAQTVTIRLLGQASSGPWGAGDLVLTLRDASRRVLRTVSR